MNQNLWNIVLKEYNQLDNRKYETIFALANGYRGLRGTLEVSRERECGNLIAGIFDKSDAQVCQIVNCPDPTLLNIYIDEVRLDLDQCKILSFSRRLNMLEGIVHAEMVLEDSLGRITELKTERFVSKHNVHRWGACYWIKPVNYEAYIFIENQIDGAVTNNTYSPMNRTKHFSVVEATDLGTGIALTATTKDKGIQICEASSLKFFTADEAEIQVKERKYSAYGEAVREVYSIRAKAGEVYQIHKYGAVITSRDTDRNVPQKHVSHAAIHELVRFLNTSYENEKSLHKDCWKRVWEDIDIEIQGDDEAQRGIRFNLFHLFASSNKNDSTVSIAAKGLQGEGYKGHVFWDTETFMLPFFIYTKPETARQLLLYRYNTLNGARRNAASNGYSGAQFPWESADEGTEETPKWGVDYDGNKVRIWTGDEEFHINADIAFAVWEYYRATRDKQFMLDHGVELFLDTAKFWQSRVEYNPKKGRFEINGVIGPDEFHEHVNNNVYTNYLAKWSLLKAIEFGHWLEQSSPEASQHLRSRLEISGADFEKWRATADKLYIPVNLENEIIEQFEGYFDLKFVPITQHDSNHMPVWPDQQGLKLDETQLIKQADVVMLLLMLGDEFSLEQKAKNYRYYEQRTMHKSSLSPSMYSIMGIKVGDTVNAYRYFMKTMYTDLEDNQGNAALGIHAASAGGAWQCAIYGFGGFQVDHEEVLCFKPWVPEHWRRLSYKIKWRGSQLQVSVQKDRLELVSSCDMQINAYDRPVSLAAGVKTTVVNNQ